MKLSSETSEKFLLALPAVLEAMQEADIVIKKQPHISDAVFEHRYPLNTHTESKTRTLLRIITGHG